MSKERYSDIKAKSKAISDEVRAQKDSSTYKRVIGVLSGLGFLVAPGMKQTPAAKVDFMDALKVGMELEPRVLEVLPAAVLSYPKTFLHFEKAPQVFRAIVDALRYGRTGPDFQSISFQRFYEAADRATGSSKRKIVSERKIPRTFRLSASALKALSSRAKMLGIGRTEYLERLIEAEALRE
ncbi:MAG: hypothetical protein J5J00_12115 [Deltaproteobacteria bacterium]|nr:hypothetical protein [Deltaproteobacteria bacterium]